MDWKLALLSTSLSALRYVTTLSYNYKKIDEPNYMTCNVQVTECPSKPADRQKTVQIYPIGIKESLTIMLDIICECPCETPGNPVRLLHIVNAWNMRDHVHTLRAM